MAWCRRITYSNRREYRSRCAGIDPPHGIWAHVCGSDLVRDEAGKLYVLEDNLRVPSGVSYMLENRAVMKRVFPELFEHYVIHPVDDYPERLAACLRSLSPRDSRSPRIAVLTPGIYKLGVFRARLLGPGNGGPIWWKALTWSSATTIACI